MLVRVNIFLSVLLIGSICQAPPPNKCNSSKQNNESEESGPWIVKVFKNMCRKAKEWAFGSNGIFTDFIVKTGEDSSKSTPSGDCCCCHKKSNSESCPESKDEKCKDCKDCLRYCPGMVCDNCGTAVGVCCCYGVVEPIKKSCDCMLDCCGGAIGAVIDRFTKKETVKNG